MQGKQKLTIKGPHFMLLNFIKNILWYKQKMNGFIVLSIFAIWNTNLPDKILFFLNHALIY